MKISLSDRDASTSPEGHTITEVLGLITMNVSKYSIAHIVAPANSQGVTRQNQFDEILIVVKGQGVARSDYATDEFEPRDVILLPAGTRYAIDAYDEEVELWAVCVPAFRPEWTNKGAVKRDWRDRQVPRGSARLRPEEGDE